MRKRDPKKWGDLTRSIRVVNIRSKIETRPPDLAHGSTNSSLSSIPGFLWKPSYLHLLASALPHTSGWRTSSEQRDILPFVYISCVYPSRPSPPTTATAVTLSPEVPVMIDLFPIELLFCTVPSLPWCCHQPNTYIIATKDLTFLP